MAELTYNGVVLNFLSTQQVDFEPVYDDLAGLDYMYTRVSIACTAVITPNVAPAISNETATDAMKRISHLLNTPRRGLLFKVGGVTLVSVVDSGGDTTFALRDVQNGPNPHATVNRIIGTESLNISFRVETYVIDCGTDTSALQYVSHRWTETTDVNELAMTKRTRTGRLVVRADLLANADQLRGLVVPPLEPDFLRISSQYTMQADGRVLAYQFVDEEQYLMPPNPAGKAEGRFSITCKDGAAYHAECYLRLQGGKPTDKTVLMIRAMSIALAKIQAANPANYNGSFPMIGTLSEDMFANDVTVRLSAQVMPAKSRVTDATLSTGGSSTLTTGGGTSPGGAQANPPSVRPNGTNTGVSTTSNFDWLKVPANFSDGSGARFDPGDRGSAQLLMVAAALQDPCLRLAVLTNTGQQTALQTAVGQTVPATISIATFIPGDLASFRCAPESDGVYEHYEVSMKHNTDTHVLSVPVGKKGANAAVLQTAAPVARRRVEWRAIKIGGPPRVPNPVLLDANWTISNFQIDPGQVEPIADGSVLRYIASGAYDYVATDATKATLAAALPPWVCGSAASLTTQPFVYSTSILETVPVRTGGTRPISTTDLGMPTLSTGGGTSTISTGDGGDGDVVLSTGQPF